MIKSPDRSAVLRFQLATVGIALDEPSSQSDDRAAPAAPAPEADRAAIRDILIAAGAPERHLDWLTRSCPSVEIAKTYKPPEPEH